MTTETKWRCNVRIATTLSSGKYRSNRKMLDLAGNPKNALRWLDSLPRSWEYYGCGVEITTPLGQRYSLLYDYDDLYQITYLEGAGGERVML